MSEDRGRDARTKRPREAIAAGLLPLEGPIDWSRVSRIVAWWSIAVLLALALDIPAAMLAATPVGESQTPFCEALRTSKFAREIKMPGNAVFTLLITLVVSALHAWHWRAGAMVLLATGLAAGLVSLMKWGFGRLRPKLELGIDPLGFDFFINGFAGLQGVPNLSTPSGHTAQAFATAAALTYLAPRGRWLFYLGAGLVGFERVGERAHYLSDAVLGAAVGIGAFHLMLQLALQFTKYERRQETVRRTAAPQPQPAT